jgi:hypothetical protein
MTREIQGKELTQVCASALEVRRAVVEKRNEGCGARRGARRWVTRRLRAAAAAAAVVSSSSPRRTACSVHLCDAREDVPTPLLEFAVPCEGCVCVCPGVNDDEERGGYHPVGSEGCVAERVDGATSCAHAWPNLFAG